MFAFNSFVYVAVMAKIFPTPWGKYTPYIHTNTLYGVYNVCVYAYFMCLCVCIAH